MEDAVLVAKMSLPSVTHTEGPDGKTSETIQMYAVNGPPGSANAEWAKYTPGGKLELTINNPTAFGRLKAGQSYKIFMVPCGADD